MSPFYFCTCIELRVYSLEWLLEFPAQIFLPRHFCPGAKTSLPWQRLRNISGAKRSAQTYLPSMTQLPLAVRTQNIPVQKHVGA